MTTGRINQITQQRDASRPHRQTGLIFHIRSTPLPKENGLVLSHSPPTGRSLPQRPQHNRRALSGSAAPMQTWRCDAFAPHRWLLHSLDGQPYSHSSIQQPLRPQHGLQVRLAACRVEARCLKNWGSGFPLALRIKL